VCSRCELFSVVHEYKYNATKRLFVMTEIVFVHEYAIPCNIEYFYCGDLYEDEILLKLL
jgi:hypothetical protein